MSEIKVNKISPRTNCGTTTLGDSGDTFTIPSGVTITNNGTANGFGATGAVNWQTTVKTSTFTATAGEGYFVNTTSGGFNVNLPAGTAGAVVGFKDYAKTFDTGNVTLVQNGSDKIGGSTVNAKLEIEGQAVTLVFVDSTQGWLVTDSGLQSDAATAQFITASGGTESTSGNFKIHKFTGPGTFTVSCGGNSQGSNTVDYLVIAGGGGGGANAGGGGGAGGTRFSDGTASGCFTAGPAPLGASALPVSAQAYPIVVGSGGAGNPNPGPACRGTQGATSSFSTISSAGGGGGGGGAGAPANAGGDGGSGGGSRANSNSSGGSGNTPPVSPPQGNAGGPTPPCGAGTGGGGGGASAAGSTGTPTPGTGDGGAGITSSITASPVAYGGGGGGGRNPASGVGGSGGTGGGGSAGPQSCGGASGTVNTGGGAAGGGGLLNGGGGTGGSGIVVIRYKFQ